MLTKNQRLELTIQDIAFGGKGIGRHEDQVIFVPFVDVGERVMVEITQIKKNFAEARLVEVLTPSVHRVEPPCKYFQACAGCQYQHLSYERQLEVKGKQLKDTLQRIGKLDVVAEPVIGSPLFYGYRNKLSLTWIAGRLGLFADDNYTLISIDRCEIAQAEVNEKLAQLRSRKINPPSSGRNRQTFILRTDELKIKLPDHAFSQVNDSMVPILKQTVKNLCKPSELLIDAYCGAGFFALEFAEKAKKIIGIEFHEEPIKLAKQQAQTGGLDHIEFIAGLVEDILPKVALPANHRFTLLLDPPRTGCEKTVIDTILKSQPAQILYVSCNPSTLARDLKDLSVIYQIEKVVPLDMFPQTKHLEAVTSLVKRDS